MFKKFLSIALAVVMLMSVAIIGASAAQVEVAADAADAPAEVGAEAGAETAAGNTISFNASSAGWDGFSWVAFHIWRTDGTAYYDWGAKKQRGKDAGSGVWSYDLDAAGIPMDGSQYVVIFYNDLGQQTYNLLFDGTCVGDTASCNGQEIENPVDSNKSTLAAFWGNADSSVNGPELAITSIGNVVGSACPQNTTKYKMFVNFLADGGKSGLANAIANGAGKTAQEIIDATAAALSLNKADVEAAIKDAAETGNGTETHDWSGDWDKSKSTLSDGEATAKNETSADGTTTGSGNGSNSNSSNSTGTTGTSSTSKSNTSTSKTGQETTVVFVMLGVMVAAAGVIFFARKKETA